MQYKNKRAKGILYPNSVTEKVEFDNDDLLNVVLVYLIEKFKNQVDFNFI